jgi:hypothetical protein
MSPFPALQIEIRYVFFNYALHATRATDLILKNSVALVRKRTIQTERPPLVGEVSANFYG